MTSVTFGAFARHWHPFDTLSDDALDMLGTHVIHRQLSAGQSLYAAGDRVPVFSLIAEGAVDLVSRQGTLISQLREGDYVGAIAILGDGLAVHAVETASDVVLFDIPAQVFRDLLRDHPVIDAFYNRSGRRGRTEGRGAGASDGWMSVPVSAVMSSPPLTCGLATPLREAARLMHEKRCSCLLVIGEAGRLEGILTTRDTTRLIAVECPPKTPVAAVMTVAPMSLRPDQTCFDAVLLMSEHGFGHVPVVENERPVGVLTQTDLVRRHSASAIYMIGDIATRDRPEDLAEVLSHVPSLLAHLVGSGVSAHQIGHMISSVNDALTRRLIALAIARFGQPPVGWLWLACGSQGRQEQTGVSDQDNCLILSDDYVDIEHGAYFERFARFISEGLNASGYVYCPGDMMASNPRWRQPLAVWRGYFERWIRVPDPTAQMLASVMFDLRPIDGDHRLHEGLHSDTLALARADSIFRSHMIANSLKHQPPLGLFRGFALIRGGEHKDGIDLKHSGVVPIVDLGRVYALQGGIEAVNTRTRLIKAIERKVLSPSGGADLIDAFDLIATLRLEHQARQVRDGLKPDNFLVPSRLSALERNHLKDAFGVVKSLQSSLGYGLV